MDKSPLKRLPPELLDRIGELVVAEPRRVRLGVKQSNKSESASIEDADHQDDDDDYDEHPRNDGTAMASTCKELNLVVMPIILSSYTFATPFDLADHDFTETTKGFADALDRLASYAECLGPRAQNLETLAIELLDGALWVNCDDFLVRMRALSKVKGVRSLAKVFWDRMMKFDPNIRVNLVFYGELDGGGEDIFEVDHIYFEFDTSSFARLDESVKDITNQARDSRWMANTVKQVKSGAVCVKKIMTEMIKQEEAVYGDDEDSSE